MNKLNIQGYTAKGKATENESPYFVYSQSMKEIGIAHNGHVRPHVHTQVFQIQIMESGNMLFKIENMKLKLNRPFILTIPANTLHESQQENARGVVISVSLPMMDYLLKDYPEGVEIFKELQILQLSEDIKIFEKIFELGRGIHQELLSNFTAKSMSIMANLNLLMVYIFRLINDYQIAIGNDDDTNRRHFKAFQSNIKSTNAYSKAIKEYAKDLRITYVHLNRICKSVEGKTATKVVQEYFLGEAQRYLIYTTHTISEISMLLSFNSVGYFSRYFKKMTGYSPKEFRKKFIDKK